MKPWRKREMKKNDCIFMRAENLGAEMEGVCRHEGMAVFVPGLLPGEETTVRITKAEKRYAFGRMEEIPTVPSTERKDPGCPVYPRCGGCSCRHMTYEASLEAKRCQTQDCLKRIAGVAIEVPPVIGMNNPNAYRNKTSLPAAESPEGPILGFYAPRSHRVIPVGQCPNAQPPTNEIAGAFLKWMREYGISSYMEESHLGMIRHLVIRVNRQGESMVTIAANASRLPHTDALCATLQKLNVVSLWLNENREHTNVILSDQYHLLYGKETLNDTLCGLNFELSPASFFQVNPEQTEKLYRTALDFAGLKGEETVCDVYCGAGTISLMMARHCRQVIGVEVVEPAVKNARENAKRNNIRNAQFFAGTAEETLPQLIGEGLRPDVVVVDPPRKGLDSSVIQAISEARPSRVVYISCNVATQARDTALFRDQGWKLVKTQPVDMFCWTAGIENVALFVTE